MRNGSTTSNTESVVRLSIIIPSFNGRRLLGRCLETVFAHKPAHSEVIVVDDGSTDGTSEYLRQAWPPVRLVRLQRNAGFCRAANAGLAAARGELVELLNNDAEVGAGWAEAAMAPFADPRVAAVAPLVCQLPFRGRIDSAGDRFLPIGIAKKRGEGRLVAAPFDRPAEVFAASAAAAFYRRSAIIDAGGFPEHFRAYLDDVDLGYRLRLAGFRCQFEPLSRVYHWVSRSHQVRSRPLQHQIARNSELLFWTNLPTLQLLAFALPHLAYVLVQLGWKGLRGDFGPWFAGKCSAIGSIAAIRRIRKESQSLCAARDRKDRSNTQPRSRSLATEPLPA